jgi:hypothetical protein
MAFLLHLEMRLTGADSAGVFNFLPKEMAVSQGVYVYNFTLSCSPIDYLEQRLFKETLPRNVPLLINRKNGPQSLDEFRIAVSHALCPYYPLHFYKRGISFPREVCTLSFLQMNLRLNAAA